MRTACEVDVPSDGARALELMDGSWSYDVAPYEELLLRAMEAEFAPFGVNASMLRNCRVGLVLASIQRCALPGICGEWQGFRLISR
jgi:hypothetical protein